MRNFKYSTTNILTYANLPAKPTCYTCYANNYCDSNHVRSNYSNKQHTRNALSCRLHFSNPFGCLLATLGKRKKKLEENYVKHSKDLIAFVFSEWVDSSSDLQDNELFLNACEHLREGYYGLWVAWFGKKGKGGYKDLSLKCDQLIENLRKRIADKIQEEVATAFSYTFQGSQFNYLKDDIYDHIQYKAQKGNDLFHFEIENKENLAFIVSIQNNTKGYLRNAHYLEMASQKEIKKVKEILNSILSNSELNDLMRDWVSTAKERNEKLEQFRKGLKSIVNASKYELFEGIEGKCNKCRAWKP